MADKKKTCFVIMPISVHDSHLNDYRGDKEHFIHVLTHLFAPAIKSINYELIPPIAKGADVIHAEIVKNLEESDLVLCDMSTLNPNVFFELGIRTALNKPVCIVKDDKTPVIPFDMGIINSHTYLSGIEPWVLESEIGKLTEHIKESIIRSKAENGLWKYFGISNVAKEYKVKPGEDAKYDYLRFQIDAIRKELEIQNKFRSIELHDHINVDPEELFYNKVKAFLKDNGINYKNIDIRGPDAYIVMQRDNITDEITNKLSNFADNWKLNLRIVEQLP